MRQSTFADSDVIRKSRSSYDPNFGQKLIDAGIYPHDEFSNPNNEEETTDYMARPRASLSPSKFSQEHFQNFKRLCRRAGDEATSRGDILSIIAGESRYEHRYASDRLFNHLEPLAGGLPTPKPDLYDGALPQQIDQDVRRDLGKHIVPCNNTSLPVAPNFFLEGKSEGGRSDVAVRQVCHNGAVGARAMHNLQNYKSAEPMYDGKANSYSATYQAGTAALIFYAHHLTAPKSPGESPECHMSQLRGYQMTSSREDFVKGAGAFRNLRDLAKAKRDDFIDHANQIARRVPADAPSTTFTDSRTPLSVVQDDESDTSPDERFTEQTIAKRTRHATVKQSRHVAMPPPAAPSSTRHLSNEPAISRQPTTGANDVQSNTRSLPQIEDGKLRRQTRPTQKVLDNTYPDGAGRQRR